MFDFSLVVKISEWMVWDGFDKFCCSLLSGNVLLRERTDAKQMTTVVAVDQMDNDNLEFEHWIPF